MQLFRFCDEKQETYTWRWKLSNTLDLQVTFDDANEPQDP